MASSGAFMGCPTLPRHPPLPSRLITRSLISSPSSVHLSSSSSAAIPMSLPQPHFYFEVIGGARDLFLPSLSYLSRPYSHLPFIASSRHFETIFASFFRSVPQVKYRRQCIRTKDDGAVALDWVAGDDRLCLPILPSLFCCLPGLTGGSGDSYVRQMLIKARSQGWRIVVFNSRRYVDSPVTTSQFYSASFLGDLHEVVSHFNTRLFLGDLHGVGWSLGANILVRYLGQEPHACPLSGAVSLCNPFNLVLADEDFHKGFNNVYDKALATSLREIFKKYALLFENIGGKYNIELAANAKTVRDFDDGLTRVDENYANSSSSNSIKYVRRTPLLCIQAANDPIAASWGIPREDIKENPNCLLIVTPKGGHLGWVAGDDAPFGSPWTDPLVIDFLQHLERGPVKSDTSQQSKEALHHLEV